MIANKESKDKLKNKRSKSKTEVGKWQNNCTLALLVVGIIFVLTFVTINRIQYRKTIELNNLTYARIIEETAKGKNHISINTILDIISLPAESPSEKNGGSSETSDKATIVGSEIMKEYGITDQVPALKEINSLQNRCLMAYLVAIVLLILAITIIFLKKRRRTKSQVIELTGYLDRINNGIYDLDIYDNSEDPISILKNEIYKTAVKLREQKEVALADKIAIKDSISDISHQLKTPLTSIMIMIDLLSEDSEMPRENRCQFIDEIQNQTLHMNTLIQALLKLTLFDANAIKFNRKTHSLRDLLSTCINNVKTIQENKGVEINTSISGDPEIYCDIHWQKEALLNVIKNAIEHSPSNSKIEISAEQNNVYTEIKIRDQGKGIPEKDLPHIFERFYKGSSSQSEGCGIGIPLAKTIIESDDGTIDVETKTGAGSVFTIHYFRTYINQ